MWLMSCVTCDSTKMCWRPAWRLGFRLRNRKHMCVTCVHSTLLLGVRAPWPCCTSRFPADNSRCQCVPLYLSRGRGGTSKAGRMQAFRHSTCHTTTHTEIPDCIYPFTHMHYVTFPHMHSCVMCDYVRRDSVQHGAHLHIDSHIIYICRPAKDSA